MSKVVLSMIAFLILPQIALGQEEQPAAEDPFDLSEINARIRELGVPTMEGVSQLEINARQLFDSGNCDEALTALESYAKNANWLSNILAAGLEPYYGASYDSRKDYPYSKLKLLIPLEEKANELRRKRDEAFVMQAECHAKIGNEKEAVALYIKALDLLSLDNEAAWERARSGLYDIIGMN